MNWQDSGSRQIAASFFSVLNSQYRTIHAEDETPLFRDYFGEEKRNAFFDRKKYDHIDRGKTERKVFFWQNRIPLIEVFEFAKIFYSFAISP